MQLKALALPSYHKLRCNCEFDPRETVSGRYNLCDSLLLLFSPGKRLGRSRDHVGRVSCFYHSFTRTQDSCGDGKVQVTSPCDSPELIKLVTNNLNRVVLVYVKIKKNGKPGFRVIVQQPPEKAKVRDYRLHQFSKIIVVKRKSVL